MIRKKQSNYLEKKQSSVARQQCRQSFSELFRGFFPDFTAFPVKILVIQYSFLLASISFFGKYVHIWKTFHFRQNSRHYV